METFRELLARSADRYGGGLAFTLKDKQGIYTNISFIRFYEEVRSLATSFLAADFKGERCAIIGKNSYAWFMTHAAAQFSGCISVPLDKELKYGEFELSLIRCRASVIFYDSKQEAMVRQAIDSGKTSIRRAFPLYRSEGETSVFDLMEDGKRLLGEGDRSVDEVRIDPDALSMLIFTSGTTSQSKIVMLSQRNVCSNVTNMLDAEPFYTTDTNMALLPYHHMFGSTGQWVMLAVGIRTVYCDGLKYFQKNMKEYKVSVFIGVPLIVEQMYRNIQKTAKKQNMEGRLRRMSVLARTLNRVKVDLRRQLFQGVLDAFGGELRMVVMGASAADPKVIQGFNDFGVLCVQGYGLTETSPVLTAERPGKQRIGSVGVPMGGVSIRIVDPDENGIGEVAAQGDNVMLGYYEDPESTEAVLKDGWFYTGDLGYIDRAGYLFLTGRKKNVIVLRNGKNVFPEELEKEIQEIPYVVENIVVGLPKDGNEKDLVVSAKIVYDPDKLKGMTREQIDEQIRADVDRINEGVPPYKRIKRLFTSDEPMVRTSTGKIRRFIEIEKMLESERKEQDESGEETE